MPRDRQIPREVLAQVLGHLRNRDSRPQPPRTEDRRPRLELVPRPANAAGGRAVLRIYDAIGGWFGITATDVAEKLDELDANEDLTVRINSPGGDVFDGTAIYNLLRTRTGVVDVVVDGLAASAASFIAQAGDTIKMERGTQMMIHDALGFTVGNAADHREMAGLLDRVSDEIAGIYAARAGLTVAEWRDRMVAEVWYNAQEAVDAGLADRTADSDDDDQTEDVAATATPAWDVAAAFHFAGRHLAPAPQLAADVVVEPPAPAEPPFDVAAAVSALKGAFVNA